MRINVNILMNERRILAMAYILTLAIKYTHSHSIHIHRHTSCESIFCIKWWWFHLSVFRPHVHISLLQIPLESIVTVLFLSLSLNFFPETLANENSNFVSFQLTLMNSLSCGYALRAEKQIQNIISMHAHSTNRIFPPADDCRIAASEQNW